MLRHYFLFRQNYTIKYFNTNPDSVEPRLEGLFQGFDLWRCENPWQLWRMIEMATLSVVGSMK